MEIPLNGKWNPYFMNTFCRVENFSHNRSSATCLTVLRLLERGRGDVIYYHVPAFSSPEPPVRRRELDGSGDMICLPRVFIPQKIQHLSLRPNNWIFKIWNSYQWASIKILPLFCWCCIRTVAFWDQLVNIFGKETSVESVKNLVKS